MTKTLQLPIGPKGAGKTYIGKLVERESEDAGEEFRIALRREPDLSGVWRGLGELRNASLLELMLSPPEITEGKQRAKVWLDQRSKPSAGSEATKGAQPAKSEPEQPK